MIPAWVVPVAELAVELGRLVSDAVANRALAVEEARLALVPKLRDLADRLESHPQREQADHDAAVDDATRREIKRRKVEAEASKAK